MRACQPWSRENRFCAVKQKTRREDRDDDKRRRKNRALTRKGDKLDGAFAHGSPDGSTTECTRGTEEHTEHRKEPKPLPFRKEFFKRQKKLAERRAQREEAKRRRDESMKARALKRKLVMQRSRRGQPIIQNLMQSILAKLGHKSH